MKHALSFRLLSCALIALGAPLAHCGGTAEPGTETGNPPIVEQRKLHVVLRGTGVEVTGDPGAVPPGARVTVVNLTTGASGEAIARADGSVNVVVGGALEDEYELTVSNGGGSVTVRLSALADSGGTGGSGSGGVETSCTELEDSLRQSVDSALAAADKSCESAEDCVYAARNFGCHFQCGNVVLSRAGRDAVRAAIETDTAQVCSELESRCERDPTLPCTTADPPAPPECVGGVCSFPRIIDELSCEQLRGRAVQEVSELLEDAPRACQVDADCGLVVSSLRCTTNCGDLYAGVTLNAAEQLNASIRAAEETWCAEVESRDSCPGFPEIPCPPPIMPMATCNAGQCEVINTLGS